MKKILLSLGMAYLLCVGGLIKAAEAQTSSAASSRLIIVGTTSAAPKSSAKASSKASVSSVAVSSIAPSVQSSSVARSIVSSSSSSSSAPDVVVELGNIGFTWTVPTKRENGDPLLKEDIGGYEIWYKLKNEAVYSKTATVCALCRSYVFKNIPNLDYNMKIFVYDKKNYYSQPMDIVAVAYPSSPPAPVTDVIVKRNITSSVASK